MKILKVDFVRNSTYFHLNPFFRIDLRILFELVNRIDNANEPIQKDLENYVYEVGMDAINRISSTAIKVD